MTTCPTCNSIGKVVLPPRPGIAYSENGTCPQCKGTGQVVELQAVEPQEIPKADGADSGTESQDAPEVMICECGTHWKGVGNKTRETCPNCGKVGVPMTEENEP